MNMRHLRLNIFKIKFSVFHSHKPVLPVFLILGNDSTFTLLFRPKSWDLASFAGKLPT